jgi:hypothetical protein
VVVDRKDGDAILAFRAPDSHLGKLKFGSHAKNR